MTLLKVLNKKRNIAYVDESKSEWDKEKKQSKSSKRVPVVERNLDAKQLPRRNRTTKRSISMLKMKLQNDIIIELKTRVADLEIELRLQLGIMSQIRQDKRIKIYGALL